MSADRDVARSLESALVSMVQGRELDDAAGAREALELLGRACRLAGGASRLEAIAPFEFRALLDVAGAHAQLVARGGRKITGPLQDGGAEGLERAADGRLGYEILLRTLQERGTWSDGPLDDDDIEDLDHALAEARERFEDEAAPRR